MSDLERRIRAAEPATVATGEARARILRAVAGGWGGQAAARRGTHVAFAMAGLAAAVAAAVVAVAIVAGRGDSAPRLILPGETTPSPSSARPAAQRPGIAGIIVFRPAAGVDADAAFARLAEVVAARARRAKATATVRRVDRDRALVTLTGTREPFILSQAISGSAVAAYDLDAVLVGTYASLRKAVVRARELAPGAHAAVAYLFRNGHRTRGPAPTTADLQRLTRRPPPGSEILGLPEGYAILRRQYVRNARGDAVQLHPTQFFLVRDEPAVGPLQVTGTGKQTSDPSLPGRPITTPIRLDDDGRRAWDALLASVSARAASLGHLQRIAVATNGDVWQMTTADASGRLDTRPGSPALEFGSFQSGSSGLGSTIPVATDVPSDGSIPAIVWLVDTYRVGPEPVVLGERVSPLPAGVRRMVAMRGLERGDLATVRRAFVVRTGDGEWSVWNYLLTSGTPRGIVLGPRPQDTVGFGCARDKPINDCGGGERYGLFAVPAAARTLRFTSGSRVVREETAYNGWSLLIGDGSRRYTRRPPQLTARALAADGTVLATWTSRFQLP